MSELLDALIAERKRQALDYKAYLARLVALTKQVSNPATQTTYPLAVNNAPLRALFDNLQDVAGLEGRLIRTGAVDEIRGGATAAELAALALDKAIRNVKKADWRGNRFKEREVRNAVQSVLGDDGPLVDTVFEIVKNQRAY
jgi:type I restriction enzyme R subunit